MYYKLDEGLRERLRLSIINKPAHYSFSVTPREIVPRDVLLANGRICTTANARREIRKYRGYGLIQTPVNTVGSEQKISSMIPQPILKGISKLMNVFRK